MLRNFVITIYSVTILILLGMPFNVLAASNSSLLKANSCTMLSLFSPEKSAYKSEFIKETYLQIEKFEESFLSFDKKLFKEIVHPALLNSKQAGPELFDGTVAGFGLKQSSLVRNSIYLLDLPDSNNTEVDCSLGRIKGVTGPKQQIAVIHTYVAGEEQIRFLTIYAPILKSQGDFFSSKAKSGLVMLHLQLWTHAKENPEKMIDEALQWKTKGEYFISWVLSESAVRLLSGNPYFQPKELANALNLSTKMKEKLVQINQVNQEIKKVVPEWNFVDYTVVFQSNSLAPGIKLRTQQVEPVNSQLERCEKSAKEFYKLFPSLELRFQGVECFVYKMDENITKAPIGGSQFFYFSKFKK